MYNERCYFYVVEKYVFVSFVCIEVKTEFKGSFGFSVVSDNIVPVPHVSFLVLGQ